MKKKYTQFIKNETEEFSVIKKRLIRILGLLIILISNMSFSYRLYGQCENPVNPTNGPQTFNGVTVREVARSGLVGTSNQSTPTCGWTGNLPVGSLALGVQIPYNYLGTNYSYTLEFNQPVNNLVFNIGGVERNESHTVSTNAGVLSLIQECNERINVNGTTMTSSGYAITTGSGRGRFRVNSSTPFTRLTFSGNGMQWIQDGVLISNGSSVNICSATIVSAIAPSISGISPSTQTRCINTPAQTITVTATGATSYQWWVNTTNSQTGATLIPEAVLESYTPPNNSPAGTLYYYAVATNSAGSTTSPTVNVVTQTCLTTCYKPGATTGVTLDGKVGITSLGRAGEHADNWPMVRKGAWLVLESKTKGFVVNGLPFNSLGRPIGISPSDYVEGMMVYDTSNKCMKIYTSTDGGTTFGWFCIATQTCPD